MIKLIRLDQGTRICLVQIRHFNFLKKSGPSAANTRDDLPTKNKKSKKENNRIISNEKCDSAQANLLPGELLVGQPDLVSNIRPIRYYTPIDETNAERCYRRLREDAYTYNHSFWKDNNTLFLTGLNKLETQASKEGRQVTEEELSAYYKDFLDGSYIRHARYNYGWWKRNFAMLIPGWLAQIHSLQLWKKRTNEHLSKLVVPDYFDSNTETEKRTLEEKPHSSDALPKKTKDRIEEVGTIDRRKEKIDSYY